MHFLDVHMGTNIHTSVYFSLHHQKKTGRTSTIMYDAQSGTFTAQQETIHTSEQDEEFALPLQAPSTLSKEKKKKKEQMKKELTLGHGGPIVRQTFVSGDYCEKVNKRRSAAVELRCCTERDLSDWRTDKKKGGGLTFARDSGKNADPLAVLVGIDEDSTCSYRARVCTPLLCPKPVEARMPHDASSSDGGVTSTTPATDPDPHKARKKRPHGGPPRCPRRRRLGRTRGSGEHFLARRDRRYPEIGGARAERRRCGAPPIV